MLQLANNETHTMQPKYGAYLSTSVAPKRALSPGKKTIVRGTLCN